MRSIIYLKTHSYHYSLLILSSNIYHPYKPTYPYVPIMTFHTINMISVCADLSCTPPIHRPSVAFTISRCIRYTSSSDLHTNPPCLAVGADLSAPKPYSDTPHHE